MTKSRPRAQKIVPAAARLVAWYDKNRRALPWRAMPGVPPDPYRVWLSEIMLQQTTVAAVASYYRAFLERWPTVDALAGAPLDEVLAAWAGLGYYARARNLHRAAQTVALELGGKVPSNICDLRKLPGVGVYTAGAIAAIAFDASEVAMDANAERVLARFFAVQEPLPQAKRALHKLAQSLLPAKRAGDFAQALMDLGALICTPRNPACSDCPWTRDCRGRVLGIAAALPRKSPPRTRPLRRGAAFVARDASGSVLLIRRTDNGLLGGMLQPPLGAWGDIFPSHAEAMAQAPFRGSWTKRAGNIRHGFTHFELEIEVYAADFAIRPKYEGNWVAPKKLARAALPTVMRKIIAHAHPNILRPNRSGDDQHGADLTEPQLPHGHQARSARSR